MRVNHPLNAKDLEYVLHRVAPLWDDLRNSHLLITGSTGFFGKWLLETLAYANRQLELNIKLSAVSRDPKTFLDAMPHLQKENFINWIKGDLQNLSLHAPTFTHILHAGTTSAQAIAPIEMADTVLNGTKNILKLAAESRSKKFLFVSSGAVYGKIPPTISHVTEDYLGGPDLSSISMTYAESKRMAEIFCQIHASSSEVQLKIARCFAFVGPHLPLNTHFAIGNFIRDALSGDQIFIQGDGSPLRSYLYAADLAIWLWRLLLTNNTGIYNIGSSQSLSIQQVAELVSSIAPNPVKIHTAKQPNPSISAERYIPSTVKAETNLEISNITPITDAIKRTFEYYGN